MCIAIVKPIGAEKPNDIILRNAYSNNPHSIGVAIYEHDSITILKNFEDFNDFLMFVKEDIENDDLVFFHFRYATHGTIDLNNCQPFFISNNQNSINQKNEVLMHNGVLQLGKLYDNKSDTRTLVDKMCQDKKFMNLSNDKLLKSNNKIAIMTLDKKFNLYGDWIEDNGCFYSNQTYKHNASECKEGYNLCDRCGEFCENCWSSEVGYHFCQKCINDKKVYIYKCSKCGNETTDLVCSNCGEKHNIMLNYWS